MTQHLIIFYLTLLRKEDTIFKIVDLYVGYQDDRAGKRTQLLEQRGNPPPSCGGTEPNRTTDYTYDAKYQLLSATVSEVTGGGKWGRCRKDRTYKVSYGYDAVGNRLTEEIEPDRRLGGNLPFHRYAQTLDKQPWLKRAMRMEYTYNNLDQVMTETAYRTSWKDRLYYKNTYTYDANGNVTGKNLTKQGRWEHCGCKGRCDDCDNDDDRCGKVFTTTYEYDYGNLLTKIKYPGGKVDTFQNCRCGTFRLQKVDSQGLRNYLYDKENDSPIFECDENYNPLVKYIKGPRIDELISKKYLTDDGKWKTVYYLYDGHGSVRQLVDERGKVVAEYDYLPFGEIIEAQGSQAKKNPFTYTGREYDRDSGLYYYRARYMDSRLGRFTSKDPLKDMLIQNRSGNMGMFTSGSSCGNGCSSGFLSRDPIGEEGGINLYVAFANTPINIFDYLGLKCTTTRTKIGDPITTCKKAASLVITKAFASYDGAICICDCETWEYLRERCVTEQQIRIHEPGRF